MLKDLIKKMDDKNENLKNISKCFENISYIIKNAKDESTFSELKDVLNNLKPVLTDLETDITNLENLLSTHENEPDKEQISDNNTLLISEIQNKVVLPYTVDDLQKILDTNKKYNNFDEIIEDLFTLPIDTYKNSSKARFKEGFNLMRKRQKASLAESLSLALELCFNNSLNPAIITACKSLDELDTYLDCLSENEVDKFDLFDIKYEICPQK